ncbi:MAG: SPFH domain-containing protein [Bryobacteraceae bacterium]|nr:SPFH domain-containing protein [Bryobacteraceae bacterium]MDW8379519.1 SPFH domain-containing protein [Bryobacterales bacterium]
MIRELERSTISGMAVLLLTMMVLVLCIYGFVWIGRELPRSERGMAILIVSLAILADLLIMAGLFTVAPNQAVVLQLFGKYVGTVKTTGLRWANPFYSKHKISLRIRNFETENLKVNDHDGNPIEIAAVVVWKVVDSAEAVFEVDNYEDYVHVQSESALRNLASAYPYDAHNDNEMSLRGNTAEVATHLRREIQERLAKAGVEVMEARISHLAYAPEIAAAMLQRQQASAIIAARQKIVEGAVGMVEMALEMLARNRVVELDPERRAAMVSNLLVVLCGERGAQPVLNTGTIYH